MIKVIVFDINPFRSTWLCSALERAGFFIVARASGREQLLTDIKVHKPQVVLIAPLLTASEGAFLTRAVMEEVPVPVVLLTSEDEKPPESLYNWCGAVATLTVPTPPNDEKHNLQISEITNILTLMHIVPVIKRKSTSDANHVVSKPVHLECEKLASPYATTIDTTPCKSFYPSLIGIAASTGGPGILQRILCQLPQNFPIPIVIVQHLSEGFSEALIKWLDEQVPLHVVEAEDGLTAKPGKVYVASGQQHLLIKPGLQLHLVDSDSFPGHCPSATAMFASLAKANGAHSVGVVLTGMGNDGAAGLLKIREKGGATFAQDETSCVVSSMPRQAFLLGAVGSVLNPEGIAIALLKYMRH